MEPENSKYLISVVGPTAIGKTALAIQLARHFKTVVLSADSRQFYREMSIGTAVPSPEELAAVPHYFIQHKSIFETYTVGDFEQDAIALLKDLFQEHDTVIMAGGSGLYVNAVLYGLDDFPEVSPALRDALNTTLRKEGITALQQELKALDPLYYQQVDLHNPQRVIRALEISKGTGKPYSSFLKGKKQSRPFNTLSITPDAERQVIYDRINRRVDLMMQNGLLEEAKALLPHQHLNALQTVGYKELFRYLEGDCELEFAVEEIKKNTRRFAKRQLTWFRKQPGTLRVDFQSEPSEIITRISDEGPIRQ
ncbi:tRNA (adenosine(37)-N6)-dimethylallyltransferase MiaA [Sinomicrobium soli]|uniref:tRNA (adenosine(37)-N6)-dimethylallyltransferase MiaA n=1 Tax=Sinomicrobium sp. N-1-3-6 TaxID=2219864 RepID=UPI000DCED8AE|nr:tRNA (adenosine(37)-N6)-dimethylallyltransferase MiaA [Sinomicrobium sp. N-1-3-6]RAV29253.1 tRNA (adenosine(37)-N6)-dimethylallyltransferase MiaA [Sinomicrobium sp. N-1-3-6]